MLLFREEPLGGGVTVMPPLLIEEPASVGVDEIAEGTCISALTSAGAVHEGSHVSELLETDVLIIGCGVAGGTVALRLADAGVPVTLVTRSADPNDTNTHWAQGGIIYKGKQDAPELLVADILRAGAGHLSHHAAAILAEEGPGLVENILLDRVGVAFDRVPSGELSLALEGGHSVPRIIHATDATGKAISEALVRTLQAHPHVTLITGHTGIDLLTPAHHSLNRLDIYPSELRGSLSV